MEVKGTGRSEKCGRGRAAECNDHLEKGAAMRESYGGRGHMDSNAASKISLVVNQPPKV